MKPGTVISSSIWEMTFLSHLALLALAAPLLANATPATDVGFFRSDAGIARSADALPENLNDTNALCWRVQLDSGHSTPVLHNASIFLTTYRPDSKELATIALEETTGRLLWRAPLVPERLEQTHQIGSPATATV